MKSRDDDEKDKQQKLSELKTGFMQMNAEQERQNRELQATAKIKMDNIKRIVNQKINLLKLAGDEQGSQVPHGANEILSKLHETIAASYTQTYPKKPVEFEATVLAAFEDSIKKLKLMGKDPAAQEKYKFFISELQEVATQLRESSSVTLPRP